ncbi:MAG: hypothetical protein ACM3VV_01115 [Deltaproteobacteria bacterium]
MAILASTFSNYLIRYSNIFNEDDTDKIRQWLEEQDLGIDNHSNQLT